MALWTYCPQDVLTDTTTYPTDRAETVGGVVTLAVSQPTIRRFRLRYGVVSSADCAGMRRFYTARCGSYEAFDFISPLDDLQYHVRFDSALQLTHLVPVYFSTGGELVLVEVLA